MTHAVDSLTEKEKEALRLLLAGHDAKSSASELGLSVHTINDRLRNARRKLDVTSSREAARILGDTEERAPQNPAHKPFGVAEGSGDADVGGTTAHEGSVPAGPARWKTGATVMILSLIIAAGALAISSGTFTEAAPPANDSAANAPASPVPTVTATETIAVTPMQTAAQSNFQPSPAVASAESESAAVAWLGLIENEEAEVSRQAAAPVMRDRHSDGLWAIGMALRNNNYGVVLERDLLAVNRRAAPAGSAASEIEVLIFETDFSNSPGAQEVLVMHRIDGRWMVADYDLSEAGDCD